MAPRALLRNQTDRRLASVAIALTARPGSWSARLAASGPSAGAESCGSGRLASRRRCAATCGRGRAGGRRSSPRRSRPRSRRRWSGRGRRHRPAGRRPQGRRRAALQVPGAGQPRPPDRLESGSAAWPDRERRDLTQRARRLPPAAARSSASGRGQVQVAVGRIADQRRCTTRAGGSGWPGPGRPRRGRSAGTAWSRRHSSARAWRPAPPRRQDQSAVPPMAPSSWAAIRPASWRRLAPAAGRPATAATAGARPPCSPPRPATSPRAGTAGRLPTPPTRSAARRRTGSR